MNPPESTRVSVDGVPVVWVDGGEPTMTVVLTFGVGWRDEQAHTVGVSHLVEHIIMREASRLTIPHNATTDVEAIRFFAVGTGPQIVDFVARVCRGIRTLRQVDDEVVSAEKRVVAAELGASADWNQEGPYRRIYGLGGIGLAEYGRPAHRSFTSAMVREFAERWMHSGNVVVTMTGPPPSDLRLDLPAGSAPARPPHPQPVLDEFPCWISVDAAPMSLTFVTTGDWAQRTLASGVVEKMIYDSLRGKKGLIYSTTSWGTRLDRQRALLRVNLDPEPAHVESAMLEATGIVRDLAEYGPSARLAELVRDSALESLANPAALNAWIAMQALAEVRGWPTRSLPEAREAMAAVTRHQVREVLQQYAASMVLATRISRISAEGADHLSLATPGWTPHQPNLTVRGIFADVASGAAIVLDPARGEDDLRGNQLHLTSTHITQLGTKNEVIGQAAIDDIALIRKYSNGYLGFDFQSGLVYELKPSAWKDPKGSILATLARVPDERWITVGVFS